jgi:hypothetical protein
LVEHLGRHGLGELQLAATLVVVGDVANVQEMTDLRVDSDLPI